MSNSFFEENKITPDVTHGVCPTCNMATMLISITKDSYRCITCGSELEQKINGKITYMPFIPNNSPEDKSGQKI